MVESKRLINKIFVTTPVCYLHFNCLILLLWGADIANIPISLYFYLYLYIYIYIYIYISGHK